MSEWQPIETYDALKVKPENAAFVVQGVPPVRGGKGKWSLAPMVVLTRSYGQRKVTHWTPLPPLPKDTP